MTIYLIVSGQGIRLRLLPQSVTHAPLPCHLPHSKGSRSLTEVAPIVPVTHAPQQCSEGKRFHREPVFSSLPSQECPRFPSISVWHQHPPLRGSCAGDLGDSGFSVVDIQSSLKTGKLGEAVTGMQQAMQSATQETTMVLSNIMMFRRQAVLKILPFSFSVLDN